MDNYIPSLAFIVDEIKSDFAEIDNAEIDNAEIDNAEIDKAEIDNARNIILSGIGTEWLEMLNTEPICSNLNEIINKLSKIQVFPNTGNIFEFLRYFKPLETRVVILCDNKIFSNESESSNLISNDRDLIKCIKDYNNIEKSLHISGDLRTWAIQKVLLLNIQLVVNCPEWVIFINMLIAKLCKLHVSNKLIFLMWNQFAETKTIDIESTIRSIGDHHIFKSPPGRLFETYDDFEKTNEILKIANKRIISWNPSSEVVVFTDGSCYNNGKSNAIAGFAIKICGGSLGGTTVCGPVLPHQYNFIDSSDPIKGFVANTATFAKPSNNRGEYLAACWCLLMLLRSYNYGTLKLVTDCNLFRMTMLEWLPKRKQKNTVHELKNLDLIKIADILMSLISQRATLIIKHVNASHNKKLKGGASKYDAFMWHGNNIVDITAKKACKMEKTKIIIK